MENQDTSVTVRFAMTKGQGVFPSGNEFNSEEISDIRKSSFFYLVFDPEASDDDLSDVVIEQCIVIYDGITRSTELNCGLYFEDGNLCGWPAPIIKFKLSRKVDHDSFKQSVWTSGFVVCPMIRDENDQEPFVFEDHNGYTNVLTAEELKIMASTLKANNLLSGKIFTKDEMENGASCLEMAPL
jgi:hypothetical protein